MKFSQFKIDNPLDYLCVLPYTAAEIAFNESNMEYIVL